MYASGLAAGVESGFFPLVLLVNFLLSVTEKVLQAFVRLMVLELPSEKHSDQGEFAASSRDLGPFLNNSFSGSITLCEVVRNYLRWNGTGFLRKK